MELIQPLEDPSVVFHSLAYLRDVLEDARKENPRASTITPGGYVICIDSALAIYDKCINDYYRKKKGELNGTKRTTKG